ncbi:MAG: hypothetical protein KFW09_02495 [Oscillospiraceae bacterium]|nr:hypothetical protein [Oscillospiraceae bacterium]
MGLFDDVISKAKDVAKIATNKTEEVVGVSKLKLKSMNINSQIKKTFEELGSAVYCMNKKNRDNGDIVKKLLIDVDKLFVEQKDIIQKISNIKHEKICNSCGTSISLDYAYCYNCGDNLEKNNIKNYTTLSE